MDIGSTLHTLRWTCGRSLRSSSIVAVEGQSEVSGGFVSFSHDSRALEAFSRAAIIRELVDMMAETTATSRPDIFEMWIRTYSARCRFTVLTSAHHVVELTVTGAFLTI